MKSVLKKTLSFPLFHRGLPLLIAFAWVLWLWIFIQPVHGQVPENFSQTLQDLSEELIQAIETDPASDPVIVVLDILNEATQQRDAISHQAERQLRAFLRKNDGYSVVQDSHIQRVREEWLNVFPDSSPKETNENVADLLGADWMVTGAYQATETRIEFRLQLQATSPPEVIWQGQTSPLPAPLPPSTSSAPSFFPETSPLGEKILTESESEQEIAGAESLFYQEQMADAEPKLDTKNMVLIPAGTFFMGSMEGDADEQPVHSVDLPAYYLDTHEVTNGEYGLCPVCQRGRGGFDTLEAEQPVVYVDWENAAQYCRFVGKRLPTEAEWEKGARAGSETEYFFGNTPERLDDYAWHRGNTEWKQKFHAQAVGLKQPNAWGLYDMAGNVMEWTSSAHTLHYQAQPKNEEEYPLRVVRGGAWGGIEGAGNPEKLRSANRFAFATWVQSFLIGFRCAADAPLAQENTE